MVLGSGSRVGRRSGGIQRQECTSTITSYNQQVAKAISQHEASNSNSHINQSDITTILQSSSSTFPTLKRQKKAWFDQDDKSLIILISAKKQNEQKLHHEQPNPSTDTITSVRRARTNVTKAVKKLKEEHIEKLVNKLENIDVDAHAAWQASLQLQAGLSGHHIDTKNKYIKLRDKEGNLTANPAEQVQIQGDFFSKQIFSNWCGFLRLFVAEPQSICRNLSGSY